MLIEENGARLLTDPGALTSEKHTSLTNLDAILFTHEHWDHYHLVSLRILLKSNPKARVVCNASVASLLEQAGIPHEVVGDKESMEVKKVLIEGFGTAHAALHSSLPGMFNTGFFINNHFWYPGDSFTHPGKSPDVLALPVAGPWVKLAEAIDYALTLKPKKCFPVHDGVVIQTLSTTLQKIPAVVLEPQGIQFYPIELNKEYEF